MADTTTDQVAAVLAGMRDRAEDELRHVDRAAEDVPWSCEDVPRLLKALEAVLELADSWQRIAVPGDAGYDDAQAFREAISRELLAKEDTDAR